MALSFVDREQLNSEVMGLFAQHQNVGLDYAALEDLPECEVCLRRWSRHPCSSVPAVIAEPPCPNKLQSALVAGGHC